MFYVSKYRYIGCERYMGKKLQQRCIVHLQRRDALFSSLACEKWTFHLVPSPGASNGGMGGGGNDEREQTSNTLSAG